MGGKQSRLQREQKHQLRKQQKEKKAAKRVVEEEKAAAVGGSGSSSGSGLSDKLVVTTTEHLVQCNTGPDSSASDVAPIVGSALNVTERDIEGRAECSTSSAEDGEEDGTKSSVTITICMLKMEPNAASAVETEEHTSTVAEEVGGVGAGPAENDVTIADDLLSRRPQQCACLENGNVGACTTESDSACGCTTTGSIDNRLNNNELSAPTPTPTSSPTVTNTTMSSSNVPSPGAVPVASATTPQPALSFMIGGHDPATISHLLHRLRHLHHHHHHHLHHHHHHHLMHLHHHLHHHHHPVTGGGGIADLPADLVSPSNSTIDWRQHQWIPAGMMVGSSNGAIARPATESPAASGASTVTPASTASQLFMDIDIDLKDKLEGLKLGPAAATATAGQRSSNNNVTEESGEHPYSVGECPTCCAMAMAANASSGSGSLGGVGSLGSSGGGGSGVAGSVANGTNIYNGNVGEVEEKILNTSNQPAVTPTVVTSGVNVPEPAAAAGPAVAVTSLATAMDNSTTVSQANDQISTEPDNTKAGSSSVATSSAVGGSTTTTAAATAAAAAPIASGREEDAERTVALEDNSSNPTTTAPATPTSSSSAAASTSSANTTSDSPPATTVTAGSVTATVATSSSSSSSSTSTKTTTTTAASCCNRKSSSSTASTLFGSLSFAGRRSRSSNARTGSCCANSTTPAEGVSPPEQQHQKSRISWIPGSGHKQQRASNGSKNVRPNDTPTSGGGGKSKKSNWPFSLKSSSGGGSSQSRTNGKVTGVHKQTTKAAPVTAAGGSAVNSGCASTGTTAGMMSVDMSNSIVSGTVGSGPTLRGNSLIASAKLLKGETDKDDSCVCTAYRKVSESPPPPSSPAPTSAAAAGPSRVAASPRPAESVEWLEEAIQGTGLLPLNLHMLSSLRAGNAASSSPSPSAAQSIAGGAPMISLSPEPIPASLLSNHHHHHHHAMAAALVADHHPSFFFSTAPGPSNHHHGSVAAGSGVGGTAAAGALFGTLPLGSNHTAASDVILLSDSPVLFDLTSDDFSVEDCDERARIQRELEIREGVDAPPNFHPRRLMSGGTIASGPAANHPIAFIYSRDLMQRGLLMANKLIQPLDAAGACAAGRAGFGRLRIHSQVDFIHCLVPDLQKITSCSFYWGKMDRYEAERLLEGKPEGTFLLRDSAQEEFLFSVSFRKYNRSLHARIEQFNHKFSFDSRDPGVFTASTVTGLLEHYKDPSCVMFFEPMLTFPLNRNFSFSLQQLCRAVIVSNTTYDGINELTLPKSLKSYLKEYHYRQRVRFRPMDEHLYSNA